MDWTLERLEGLITGKVEERLDLEYKGAQALGNTPKHKTELVKDVTAMANSAGGIIIYGIKEYDEVGLRHLPEKLDPINRHIVTKEWLENIINNAQPRISDIAISVIQIDDTGGVVYILEIPQSHTAHQNPYDKKYYKRFNFSAEPMSDYEIRDVMHRSNSAIIEVSFLISKEIQHIVPDDFRINVTGRPRKSARTETKVWLELHALNSGSVFAEFVAGHITLPSEVMDEFWRRDIETDDNGDITLRFDNSERIRHGIQTVGEKRIPLLPGMQENLGRFSLNPAIEHFGQRAIKWRVFTEKSAPRQGKILMSNISISTKEGRFSEDSLGQKKRIT